MFNDLVKQQPGAVWKIHNDKLISIFSDARVSERDFNESQDKIFRRVRLSTSANFVHVY